MTWQYLEGAAGIFERGGKAAAAAEVAEEAVREAIHRFGPPEIMNTDQGTQFTPLRLDRPTETGRHPDLGVVAKRCPPWIHITNPCG
ncbi:hypothetical protein [Fuscovulum blasticum]|uniref:hypothetical protein n=1 Tax=Fuscovulum blasticum TaxID=1075 RepID=UPI000F4F628B